MVEGDGVESLDDEDVDELMGFLEDELVAGGTGRGRSLAAGLAAGGTNETPVYTHAHSKDEVLD